MPNNASATPFPKLQLAGGHAANSCACTLVGSAPKMALPVTTPLKSYSSRARMSSKKFPRLMGRMSAPKYQVWLPRTKVSVSAYWKVLTAPAWGTLVSGEIPS